MARGKRANGLGTIYQRKGVGPWYASWKAGDGRRVERSTRTMSKPDAERILQKWTQRAALEREGLVAPEGGTKLDQHAAAPLAEHRAAYVASLKAQHRSDRYVSETERLLELVAEGAGWGCLAEVDAESAEQYANRMKANSATPRTIGKHLGAFRSFVRWCIADGRLAVDPLARVKMPRPDRQTERRALTLDEWPWLAQACESGPVHMNMTGPERLLLYRLAIETGLRQGEIRSLTRASLRLEGENPHVLVEAKDAKNKRAARQYVRPGLAADLRQHAKRLMPGSRLFANMPRRTHLARIIRADVEAARQAWIAEAGSDADLMRQRLESDFLAAQNEQGQHLDFHCLRVTTATWAAAAGVGAKAIQRLMRHSKIDLSMNVYARFSEDDAALTVLALPALESASLRMTGTEQGASTVPAASPATAGRNGAESGNSGPMVPEMNNAENPRETRGNRRFQAEREGFEPSVRVAPYTGLAIRPLQPLGHRSRGLHDRPENQWEQWGSDRFGDSTCTKTRTRPPARTGPRPVPPRHSSGRSESVRVAFVLVDQAAEVLVFAACGFEVEDQVFDAQAEVVEALLEFTERLAHSFVAGAGFLGEGFEFGSLVIGKLFDLVEKFAELVLEILVVHISLSCLVLVEAKSTLAGRS